ncbi:MAG: hypothetical protein KQI62_02115 [Deltaproteobacteria bacterium]|nr:hypothetical protein [Deltaproteobacteria bacterium]
MELPRVKNVIKDPRRDVTYVVMAYRQLTRQEIVFGVQCYLSRVKKKPKKGDTVTIYSVFS